MSDWSDEVENEEAEREKQHQKKERRQQRQSSIERYRPGAKQREDLRRPNNEQQPGLESNDLRHLLAEKRSQQGTGGAAPAPAPDVAPPSLTHQDLRHRLNQRSRDPILPKEEPQRQNGGGRGGSGGNGRNQHRRVQGRGAGGGQGGQLRPIPTEDNHHRGGQGGNYERSSQPRHQQQQHQPLPRPKRNTENFNPSHAPPEMRILAAQPGLRKYNREYTTRDVLVVNDLFGDPRDMKIYDDLLGEIKESGVNEDLLWQSWHGDSHMIADDKRRWKDACPTFHMVLDRIRDYFDMDIKATRLNWYRDSTEWKPFHHDAAAVKADKAKTQNFTVAVSFGMERDAAFEHAKTKTVISMPQPHGTIYTFGRDVNILWRHGIPQLPLDKYSDQGRISIIAWGWIKMVEL